ncbi:MAG: hypothetical protein K0S09_952 [Sphingobacteriaceae bacterium]|jgi:hypothetical protein|nr:hypothetical protein [Sphingobacteriaceae bacterium]
MAAQGSSNQNYSYLLKKIDEFIRKYYLNKIIRGSIYLAATLFASYILVTLAEYYGNFNPQVRTLLFYAFIGVNIFITARWIVIPALSYAHLGKTISHEKASEIIGEHFSDVKDKLLNTLQLKKLADSGQQAALIEASINQKIGELRPVPFTSAVKLQENRRYIKYAVVPFVIILVIAVTAPSIFSESTERLLNHDRRFVKKAPFQFVLLNKNLSAVQGDDYTLQVKMTGNEIPQDIYVEDGANTFKLDKESIIRFNYTFKNLQKDKKIRLIAGEFSSEDYFLEVKRKPSLLNFDVSLDYPAYLGKQDETVSNSGDLTVPAGTKINWKFKAQNTDAIKFVLGSRKLNLQPTTENKFSLAYRAMASAQYSVRPINKEVATNDSVSYRLTVIPDLSPAIQVEERPDSVNNKIMYFVGQASDDYGFTKLNFTYRIVNDNKVQKTVSTPVNLDKNAIQSNFFHAWDVNEVNAEPGQQVEYFFEIFDNDGVNGPKSSRSAVRTLKMPTKQELENKISESSESVKSKMEQAIKQAAQLESQAKKVAQNLMNKRELTYEEKKQIEQLLEKQKNLESLVKDIQKENKENLNDRQDLNKEQRQEILDKQKQIEDLFNNVLDEKTKELLKNIQKLLEQNNKNMTQDELSKMQMDNKTLQKELDRILDLYKQLEFDQKLTESIDKLKDMAKEQQKLANDSKKESAEKQNSKQKNADAEALKQKQDELNKEFKDLQKDLKDLEQKNEELNDKSNFENPENDQQEIEDQQEQSSKNLENKNTQKASQSQEKAAQQMQQMSDKMEQMQQQEEEQEAKVNMQQLRDILDKLVTSSFDQEDVMQKLRNARPGDPGYVALAKKQRDVLDNLKTVQDSLYQLSKNVPQIQSVVNKEIAEINKNINSALAYLGDRRTAEANRSQQYAMTSINNLALMLSEAQEQMQKAMQNAQQGKGKKGKPSLSQLSKMQQQLNKNMQKAREQMQQQGQQKPGQKGQQQQGQGMSEQLARMAREQQMIRQQMQEINREMNKDGKGGLGNLDQLSKEMEQTETDLVNKRIQQETLIRQQEILTKLLDAEKAERERDQDSKRESKQGKDMAPNYKLVLEEYKKLKQRETELLKTVPPALNSFYKIKVGDYFKYLNSGK